ncbi:MAG: hypothetical protein CK429_35275 [Mycobacterium sp.]|uniref:hypothetical protein n=1 Tax=Mycobacterium haemophilum TaxID=29311 RepID=UPI000699FFC2|nr:hypothetical protein [Mycobacterium haemophilum]PJE01746.1 MAG: hypothetical protein CK429_35275 [Mycobacterium sp.]
MSEDVGAVAQQPCRYPGCSRPSRPDSATGRPSLYCEQADAKGQPVHNRVNAWRARHAGQAATAVATDQSVAVPVSMARATLEQRLSDFPGKLTEFRDFLDTAIATIREASDIEAAGVEVEDAHRDALTKVAEAERRASAAERSARVAEERAEVARRERQEAEAVAEDSVAETERVAQELGAELAGVREDAEATVAAVRTQLDTARREHAEELAQRDRAVDQARAEAEAAKLDTAAAVAAKTAAEDALNREIQVSGQLRTDVDSSRRQAENDRAELQAKLDTAESARQQAQEQLASIRLELAAARAATSAAEQAAQFAHQTAETLRRELEQTRADMNAERDALRAAHEAQIDQIQRSADQRADALNQAIQALQSQPAPRTRAPRKSRPDTQT